MTAIAGSIIPAEQQQAEIDQAAELNLQHQQALASIRYASQRFTRIAEGIADLQEELMQAAIDMHEAKCRADKAVAQLKALT
jgi:hypothetical protein